MAVYFGGRFAFEAYRYVSLREKTPVKIVRWEVEEEGSRFAIRAVYKYSIKEKILTGTCRVGSELFLNDVSALTSARQEAKKRWVAYYDPLHPQYSTLEKKFPTGYAFRFSIAALISIYFFIIRNKFKSIKN